MTSDVNVAEVERWASALGGAALAAFGIRKGMREHPVAGAMIAAAGSTLIYRGATGHCPVYGAMGIDTADGDTRTALGGSRGINVEDAVTISTRSREELYRFWRDFERLPSFMQNLVSVRQTSPVRSHWVAKAPAGRTVEWDAEVINEIPNELIGWRTLDGADVVSAGSVRFQDEPGNRGVIVRVHLRYDPPAGKLGSAVAWLFGSEPSQQIREDLRRFKQLMETGEIATTKGQPRGRQSITNYD